MAVYISIEYSTYKKIDPHLETPLCLHGFHLPFPLLVLSDKHLQFLRQQLVLLPQVGVVLGRLLHQTREFSHRRLEFLAAVDALLKFLFGLRINEINLYIIFV